jgi:pimeloyl-ACP methyl ester carboxylesterase
VAAIVEQKLVDKLSNGGTLLHWSFVEGSNKPTVVLLHYTFGNHKILQRHVEMFNDLGHSTVTFNLFGGSTITEQSPYKQSHKVHFLYSLWIEQITDVLDTVTGPKIFFAMSFPSFSAFIASSGRADVIKFICDGGPFGDVLGCIYRLYDQQGRFFNPVWRFIVSVSGLIWLGPHAGGRLSNALDQWKPNVPILSIRGGEDTVVPPKVIDGVFRPHKQLKVIGFEIAGAGHLDALKKFPEVYTGKIREFLNT